MFHLFSLPAYMDWHWLWLAVAAFLAGMLNAVAGGGSFLLFPAMLGTGMLPIEANATNTLALWPGHIASSAAYRRDVRKNLRLAVPMGVAGLVGGGAGALVLLHTPQMTFLRLVPWLLLGSALIFAFAGPVSRWLDQRRLDRRRLDRRRLTALDGEPHRPHRIGVTVAALAISFYMGYFGAGAGFLLITMLSLAGYQDLHEINALKVVTTAMANGIAILLFILNGQIEWRFCLLAMLACGLGGFTSATYARRIPQPFLRGLVVVIGLGMAAWFFWRIP